MDLPPEPEPAKDPDPTIDLEGLTTLLARLRAGEHGARDELFTRVFERLRCYAHRLMPGQNGHTLQPTALIGEAWLRLTESEETPASFEDRRHFLATVARTMRWVVVDQERARRALRRQAPGERVELDSVCAEFQDHAEDLLALDEALKQLGQDEPELEEVVELRFFLGCTIGETAEVLGVSRKTVERRFADARSWLYRQLGGE
jgi:RNA polymerase sigma factor (TIGR02999 family)